jgi:large subunit ribosomal protein L29
MKLKDITQKTDKELATMLIEARKNLADAKVDMRTKQVANVKQINALKKTVARVLTIQQQRRLQGQDTKEEANG